MANLQNLLAPVRTLANTPASDAGGKKSNDSSAGLNAAQDVEHGFSKLLNDPVPSQLVDVDKPRTSATPGADPNSLFLSSPQSSDLDFAGGKELPFGGQLLPFTSMGEPAALNGDYSQLSAAELNSLLSPAESAVKKTVALGEPLGSASKALAAFEALAARLAYVHNKEFSGEEVLAGSFEHTLGTEADSILSVPEIPAATILLAEAEQDPSLMQVRLEAGSDDLLASERLGFLAESNKLAVDSNSQSAKALASVSANTAGFVDLNKLVVDGIKQVSSKGVDFLSGSEGLGGNQDPEAEFFKLDGVISGRAGMSGDKLIQPLSAGVVTAATAEVNLVQNLPSVNATPLLSALSQWRENQDASGTTSIETADRQSFARLSVPVNQAGWGESLGRQLNLLLARNMDSAQIQLDPPELGPLGVKIQINQDQVSLQFTSGHAVVREALEQSSQRLQQMLNDEGLELVDVGVSDDKSEQNGNANKNGEHENSASSRKDESINQTDESDGLLTLARSIAIDDGKIDYFI